MSTGTFIVTQALKRIDAHSQGQPAIPEELDDGKEVLNSELQMWRSQNILIGTNRLVAVGDELGEPPDTTNGIVDVLALRLYPDYASPGAVVPDRLVANAERSFLLIKDIYQTIDIPDKVTSSTLPLGQGNRQGGFPKRTFKGVGGTVNG